MCILLVNDFCGESEEFFEKLKTMPHSLWLVTARFCCGIILHMKLADELHAGLQMMKFSLNHEYRFSEFYLAFLAGFLQTTMIIVVESVNILAILASTSAIEVVLNFMALAVVSEFDDTFFDALGRTDEGKCMIYHDAFNALFEVTRTTSKDAIRQVPGNELRDKTHLTAQNTAAPKKMKLGQENNEL